MQVSAHFRCISSEPKQQRNKTKTSTRFSVYAHCELFLLVLQVFAASWGIKKTQLLFLETQQHFTSVQITVECVTSIIILISKPLTLPPAVREKNI